MIWHTRQYIYSDNCHDQSKSIFLNIFISLQPHVTLRISLPPHVTLRISLPPHVTLRISLPPHVTLRISLPPHVTLRISLPPHVTLRISLPPHVTLRISLPPHVTLRISSPPHATLRISGLFAIWYSYHSCFCWAAWKWVGRRDFSITVTSSGAQRWVGWEMGNTANGKHGKYGYPNPRLPSPPPPTYMGKPPKKILNWKLQIKWKWDKFGPMLAELQTDIRTSGPTKLM